MDSTINIILIVIAAVLFLAAIVAFAKIPWLGIIMILCCVVIVVVLVIGNDGTIFSGFAVQSKAKSTLSSLFVHCANR